ncbi:pyochelin biosynthetic protein PchC [Catenulispora sp. GP43]|uniref:thioesterase II family protein n=1 Tax=Catenulispora sp. GP43 TaxID=3156263 RepID=UPI0035155180
MSARRPDRYASGRWLRIAHPRPEARTVLVAFPHAGGSATFFRAWGSLLPPHVELVAVQYPGRLDRLREPCIDDVHQLADAVLKALDGRLDRDLALFGHSLGALVAFETALRMESQGLEIKALFQSSPPAREQQARRRPHLSDESLLAELRRLGATPTDIIEDPRACEAILVGLRGDYRAAAHYRPDPDRRLRCPVDALIGDGDPDVSPTATKAWAEATTGPWTLNEFPGDHFYLVPQRDAVLRLVADRLGAPGPGPLPGGRADLCRH